MHYSSHCGLMTEDEAQSWLKGRGWLNGSEGERLRWLVFETLAEADRQNLISAGTRDMIWSRHIVDSAQLLDHATPEKTGLWVDIGSGAGFPGLVIACLTEHPILLVEPRPLRVAYLERCIAQLGLAHCTVSQSGIGAVERPNVSVISARAYAPLSKIFATASHLADLSTTWVLPKGRNANLELETARTEWQGVFHVKQSVTDAESHMIVATQVERGQRPSQSISRGKYGQKGRRARA